MKKSILLLLSSWVTLCVHAQFGGDRMPSDGNPDHTILLYKEYTDNAAPAITVYLPQEDKATGAACVICPGGGMMSLSWDGEFLQLARFLNERGIAAIGLRYTLRNNPRVAQVQTQRNAGAGGPRLQATITETDKLSKANCNPVPGVEDASVTLAISDAIRAMQIIRSHAAEWNLDPAKIGYVGYSAGGGVAVGATVRATEQTMPGFLCSVYGPSLIDVDVPAQAPPLFIAVHADHPNVAAGCLALFLEWKKAGTDAEMHVYGRGTGGLFGGAGSGNDTPTDAGRWQESFYSWLKVNVLGK
ncbi:MAG: alpha/beta hydrolase fold domain-containing protein [Bacteroidaceae bacterium]|nr:alpha/beta hydrolase fold domain-containing protein [Bacteroidaceae bacterium]